MNTVVKKASWPAPPWPPVQRSRYEEPKSKSPKRVSMAETRRCGERSSPASRSTLFITHPAT